MALLLLFEENFKDWEVFIFRIFDNDRDGKLSTSEIEEMFKTSITSIRQFNKGPGSESDEQWI